tara:strand:- start:36 stop:407 length:372 start_codon:yes stop_codon:yes gene_type:complete
MANAPYKMKSPTLMAGTKGAPIQNSYSPMTKKPTLGEWFRSTKLGDDLNKAGKQIKGDVDKIKSKTNKVTNTIKDNISFDKKNVKEKIKSKKNSLETRKSNFDTKVKKDVGGLLNKLFIKKKK